MVFDIVQLFTAVSYTITYLGCLDDFLGWACITTRNRSSAPKRLIRYFLPTTSHYRYIVVFAAYTDRIDRLKDTDFEKAMKLITTRIDVKDDDKLMRLVFKEAIANGALRKYDL